VSLNGSTEPEGSPEVQPPTALTLRGITKSYGVVRALDGVDLDARGGEVHGLLGANGAGKSTLVKSLAGLTAPDSGSISLDGTVLTQNTMAGSFRSGIRVAHQELAVVPTMTVAQHLVLGHRLGRRQRDAQLSRSRDLFSEWGLDVKLGTYMRDIPPALQACVMLAKTLEGDGKVLVLDEPTASLGAKEVSGLFRIIERRVSEGAVVLFVSHRLAEVRELCSTVTVLRNGRRVRSSSIEGMTEEDLELLITGEAADQQGAGSAAPMAAILPDDIVDLDPGGVGDQPSSTARKAIDRTSTPALKVEGMRLETRVADVSFDVASGEILGIAGLVGSGRTEVLEAIMGLRPLLDGSLSLDGAPFSPRNAYSAMRAGLALVPEERARQALFIQQDIGFNFASARFRSEGGGHGGWRAAYRTYDKTSTRLSTSLRVKATGLRAGITSLSGGNQQKIVLGRFLLPGMRVLLLDEPTRGVDVGARRDFQRVIRELADQGLAIIYVSSELAELKSCDRVVVMVQGHTTVEAPTGDAFDEEDLTRLCFRPRPPRATDQESD
jgi:ribose transport system ATP-binding protein